MTEPTAEILNTFFERVARYPEARCGTRLMNGLLDRGLRVLAQANYAEELPDSGKLHYQRPRSNKLECCKHDELLSEATEKFTDRAFE